MEKSILLYNSNLPDKNAVYLYNEWVVRKEFYKMILSLVERFIPFMAHGHTYTLETIIPADIWKKMSVWEHIQAGWILSHIAVNGILDIAKVDSKKATKRYMRT